MRIITPMRTCCRKGFFLLFFSPFFGSLYRSKFASLLALPCLPRCSELQERGLVWSSAFHAAPGFGFKLAFPRLDVTVLFLVLVPCLTGGVFVLYDYYCWRRMHFVTICGVAAQCASVRTIQYNITPVRKRSVVILTMVLRTRQGPSQLRSSLSPMEICVWTLPCRLGRKGGVAGSVCCCAPPRRRSAELAWEGQSCEVVRYNVVLPLLPCLVSTGNHRRVFLLIRLR